MRESVRAVSFVFGLIVSSTIGKKKQGGRQKITHF